MSYPYTMTYTPETGDTIIPEHINTSNQEHISNNVPSSIDDASIDTAAMQVVADPYPGASESKAETLAQELHRLRYQLLEFNKRFDSTVTHWYHDVGNLLNVSETLILSDGGTEIQLTDKSTGVTLNTYSGQITTHADPLAAGGEVFFTVTNSVVTNLDTIILNIASGRASSSTAHIVGVANGSFQIMLTNHHASIAETGAIVLNFCVLRGASS